MIAPDTAWVCSSPPRWFGKQLLNGFRRSNSRENAPEPPRPRHPVGVIVGHQVAHHPYRDIHHPVERIPGGPAIGKNLGKVSRSPRRRATENPCVVRLQQCRPGQGQPGVPQHRGGQAPGFQAVVDAPRRSWG